MKPEFIPQSGQFVLKLPAATSIADHGLAFEQLLSEQPLVLSPSIQNAQLNAQGLSLQIPGLPAAFNGHGFEAFSWWQIGLAPRCERLRLYGAM